MGAAESTSSSGPRNGPNIYLNVYIPADGNQSSNDPKTGKQSGRMQMPGFGIYHSGLQVFNTEYTFAGGDFDGSGVQEQVPKATPAGSTWQYKETVDLGKTTLSEKDIRSVLSNIRNDFPAKTYDLTSKNCNHFTELLSTRLDVHHNYPSWVNRAAKWGNSLKGGMDPVQAEKRKMELDKLKRDQEAASKAALKQKQSSLKPEPPQEAEGALEVQINCPNGKKTKRRFLNSDTIGDVMTFVCAFDLSLSSTSSFHLRQNMPRKVFADKKETLQAAGFGRRENLFVELKH